MSIGSTKPSHADSLLTGSITTLAVVKAGGVERVTSKLNNSSSVSGSPLDGLVKDMSGTDIGEFSGQTDNKSVVGWMPTLAVGVFMAMFLLVSFLQYHRKSVRKRKAQNEYLEYHLAVKHPRIAAPLCHTHLVSIADLASSLGAESLRQLLSNGHSLTEIQEELGSSSASSHALESSRSNDAYQLTYLQNDVTNEQNGPFLGHGIRTNGVFANAVNVDLIGDGQYSSNRRHDSTRSVHFMDTTTKDKINCQFHVENETNSQTKDKHSIPFHSENTKDTHYAHVFENSPYIDTELNSYYIEQSLPPVPRSSTSKSSKSTNSSSVSGTSSLVEFITGKKQKNVKAVPQRQIVSRNLPPLETHYFENIEVDYDKLRRGSVPKVGPLNARTLGLHYEYDMALKSLEEHHKRKSKHEKSKGISQHVQQSEKESPRKKVKHEKKKKRKPSKRDKKVDNSVNTNNLEELNNSNTNRKKPEERLFWFSLHDVSQSSV